MAAVHGVTVVTIATKPPFFASSKLPATQRERDRTKTKFPLPPPNLSAAALHEGRQLCEFEDSRKRGNSASKGHHRSGSGSGSLFESHRRSASQARWPFPPLLSPPSP
ncbi:hypothetical protein PIB30_001131 [Stylosanthes scabra]|uniref:Uncharacterized protein n=1 Tax=Stylosanthes scabra TaxID=79078 RepID=A0ABU6U1J0_9FABA|nr:hypothetical protein [Stylosanthes scabra]